MEPTTKENLYEAADLQYLRMIRKYTDEEGTIPEFVAKLNKEAKFNFQFFHAPKPNGVGNVYAKAPHGAMPQLHPKMKRRSRHSKDKLPILKRHVII